jgi:hypothetical protein
MADPISSPDKPVLETGQAALDQHLTAIPEGKKGALVLAYERSNTWLPSLQVGMAWRVNGVMSVGGDTRLQQKAKPTTLFYTAFTW